MNLCLVPNPTDPSSSLPTSTTASLEDCRCVPVDQCQRTREEQISGAGAIDERFDPLSYRLKFNSYSRTHDFISLVMYLGMA